MFCCRSTSRSKMLLDVTISVQPFSWTSSCLFASTWPLWGESPNQNIDTLLSLCVHCTMNYMLIPSWIPCLSGSNDLNRLFYSRGDKLKQTYWAGDGLIYDPTRSFTSWMRRRIMMHSMNSNRRQLILFQSCALVQSVLCVKGKREMLICKLQKVKLHASR